MMLDEFNSLIDNNVKEPTRDEFSNIEFVYTWHPANFSKQAIASLYSEFGMSIIYDMIPRSAMALEHQTRVESLKQSYLNAREAYEDMLKVDLTTKEVLDEWQREQH